MQPSLWNDLRGLDGYRGPMRAAGCLLVVLALSVSGCIAGPSSPADTAADAAGSTGPVRTVDEPTFTGSVGPAVDAQERVASMGWSYDAAGSVVGADLTLTWQRSTNRFGLQVETPDGTERFDPPGDAQATTLEATLDGGPAGRYRFAVVVPQGATAPDDLTLEATIIVRSNATGTSSTMRVYQEAGQWVAEITYTAEGAAKDRMEADVQVANGHVRAETTGEKARVQVTAWGRASTRDAAIERARSVDVEVDVDGDRILGKARTDDGDWNRRGAHADLATPSRLSGTLSTSNGPVELVDLDGGALTADTSNGEIDATGTLRGVSRLATSNGRITGDLSIHDDLTLDTSNGAIDPHLTPGSSLELSATTSNGGIDLGLAERSDIAYELAASTSNGDITEDMEEADLEGDEDDATLRTRNGDGREIQVTGSVDTSNAEIHFAGR